ncbi:MAG: serine--tRNA ligase [Acidimicrobiia bacterium]|nr:MAG: serine--tRNA ligase [Acidimicrobiia bacterium]
MIDLRRLRDDPGYRSGIERKRVRAGLIDEVLAADEARRALVARVDALRARQNAASKEIGKASPEDRAARIEAAALLKEELGAHEKELAVADARLRELALALPNPAHPAVPDGGEDDGAVLRVVGEAGAGTPALDHAAFGEAMGFVDTEHAAEAMGSRFAYLMREAALVELALVDYATRVVVGHGFVPVVTPTLVRERTMEEAGFFPTDRSQVYEVDGGELFLVGTSEIALSALHRGETLTADRLPARYAGLSTCYRREAGTYGKDTRGIFRVHQFDKVEMFSFSAPGESEDEHERILAIEEEIIGGLGIPYRVVDIAAGDLGAAAARKFDIEGWLPSEGRYRELTSCSNYLEYSARRLGTRVKAEKGSELVHTLNGTACAISRTLVFLFEHYQEADGGFAVPDVLQPYTGFTRVEARG